MQQNIFTVYPGIRGLFLFLKTEIGENLALDMAIILFLQILQRIPTPFKPVYRSLKCKTQELKS